jgi:hypothetical protein
MSFINELPADEILDLLDKYVEEEYGHEAKDWTVENRLMPEFGKMAYLASCRIRFTSDEEI